MGLKVQTALKAELQYAEFPPAPQIYEEEEERPLTELPQRETFHFQSPPPNCCTDMVFLFQCIKIFVCLQVYLTKFRMIVSLPQR
jgi:hypothetical protein